MTSFLIRQTLAAAAIVLVAALIGLAANAIRPEPLPLIQDWEETLARRSERQLPDGLIAVDLERMKSLYLRPDILVLDARPKDFYRLEHIPGAESLPLDQAGTLLSNLSQRLMSSRRVIVYCEGVTCPAGRELGRRLKAAGVADVAVYLGGLEEWTVHGLPVAAGDKK
ncbi:MAG: rhodanese-like domain-containing protein [Thermodesulfobacteriota bacterium]